MKKEYIAPEMKVEELVVEDVITTSGEDTGEGGTEVVNPFG